jgi:cytochrome c553
MNAKLLISIGVLGLSLQLLGCGRTAVSFSADIAPIFQKHCIQCHANSGEGVTASGFSVHDYASVMKGTNLGVVVIPGSSISSTLYLVVAQKTAPEIQMPPHHGEAWAAGRGSPLSEKDVENIAAWIDQGALDN